VQKLKEAARIIQFADFSIALTGAGISVESGIPAFRGAQGLWQRYDPFEYAHIEAFLRHPAKVWQMLRELDLIIQKAQPNPAHLILAAWERKGYLKAVITQNVDNLHQAAGSKNVIEFHGNASRLRCLKCDHIYARDEINLNQTVPLCSCGGLLKPDVVFFGENIPTEAFLEARAAVGACDVMLVVGTSAEVAPANTFPWEAKKHGAKIIEVNINPTVLTKEITDIFLEGRASEVLTALNSLISG